MVGQFGAAGVSGRKRARRALVRPDPPAPWCCVIHDPAHDWMAKAKAARHGGGPHEIDLQELVERDKRLRLIDLSDRCKQRRVKRLARHGARLEKPASIAREASQLLADSRDHSRRRRPYLIAMGRCQRHGRARVPVCSGKLLEIKRVASTLEIEFLPQRWVGARIEQRTRLRTVQWSGLQAAGEPFT